MEDQPLSICEIKNAAHQLVDILELTTSPVGVRFVFASQESLLESATHLNKHRYCQALMKARRGEMVILDAEGISCPAAAAAFGFRTLPEGLKSGQGLVGYGIVSDPLVGQKMFANMPSLTQGLLSRLEMYPLDQAPKPPDIVVVEGEVEQLMWINLAYLNTCGGERLHGSTAILQATCVDSTIIPYIENRLNFGFGCYGCREATDLGTNETVIGFPAALLTDIAKNVIFLGKKAISNSRSKKIYQILTQPQNNG